MDVADGPDLVARNTAEKPAGRLPTEQELTTDEWFALRLYRECRRLGVPFLRAWDGVRYGEHR
jgi:hypothetical protein